MVISLFNGWYFFWLALSAGGIVGLYYALRKKTARTQKIVLFSLLAFGFILHFLKLLFPPYSTNESLKLSESWFVNICGANIGLFPFLFLCKNKHVRNYMFYMGIISGFLSIMYPVEPIEKAHPTEETLDIIRFYYHHWSLLAVPLLMALLRLHTVSYKGILCAPIGLLIVMLFIILNQVLQSEIGFISPRNGDMFDINYKNSSFIWEPKLDNPIGKLLALFCPDFFKTIPVGQYAGQEKYWPWFWMICPIFVLITPLAFLVSMIFDAKNFGKDMKNLPKNITAKWQSLFRKKAISVDEDTTKNTNE